MAVTNGYTTVEALRGRLGNGGTAADETKLEQVIEAASREIDGICNRRFYQATETRIFTAEWPDLLEIDDLTTLTTLETDDLNDRSYNTAWSATDYELEPANNAFHGHPYTSIETYPTTSKAFPTYRRGVRILGVWGWPSIPMAEGAWYDSRTAITSQLMSNEGEMIIGEASNFAHSSLIRIYEACSISKIGVFASYPPVSGTATAIVSLHSPSTDGKVGEKIADLGSISVPDTDDGSAILSDDVATPVAVDPGWYFLVIASGVEFQVPYFSSPNIWFTGPLQTNEYGDGSGGFAITATGIATSIPADLSSAAQELYGITPQIFFQITHAT